MKWKVYALMAAVLASAAASSMLFTVDETQYTIVTTLGKPVRTIMEPGLYWKWPVPVQSILPFDKRLQVLDLRPTENFTLDRKNLAVDGFACWRVADPDTFLVKVRTVAGAENSLGMLVASELSTELGRHELGSLISVNEDEVCLQQMMDAVTDRCRQVALEDYGIQVIDVRLKRVNLPDENKSSVYERMRAEREQKAREYRAEGEEQAMIIRGKTEQEKRQILSTAYKESERIRGAADAEAIRIHGEAYAQNPELYRFLRTLRAYEKILGEDTTVVMSSDSELLRLLTGFDPDAFAAQQNALMRDQREPKAAPPSSGADHGESNE